MTHHSIPEPTFRGNLFSRNGHFETIIPSLFRNIKILYLRKRLELPDGDFIDLDFLNGTGRKLLVLFHGLEGSSGSQYMKGFARYFSDRGFAICAVNFRSCSGQPNRLARSYHSGATEDADAVLTYLSSAFPDKNIYLAGFSLGGNMMLKYLGDHVYEIPQQVKAAVAFSVPIDLAAGSKHLANTGNRIYMKRFLSSLNRKIIEKAQHFKQINISGIGKIKTFDDWDTQFTAPLHGYRDATDYYTQCSSKPYLNYTRLPTLLVNAGNDPFLPESCYVSSGEFSNTLLKVEIPLYGGHCGFAYSIPNGRYYNEERAFAFLSNK